MTSPDPKSSTEVEGGGVLPALLAGAGILLVAALFIFGGDDETSEASENKDKSAQNANSRTAAGARGKGVAERQVDDATETARARAKLNPRIANAIVSEGMNPNPKPPEPTSFDTTADEIAYWEDQLRKANQNLEIRQRAVEYIPGQEDKIREHGTAEDLAEFQKRKKVVQDNLDRALSRVAEVEDKLVALRGG